MTTDLQLRPPTLKDGAAVAQLVREAGGLEPNTTYAYLLLCSHFAATSVVAEQVGQVQGVVLAYRIPGQPRILFVWQVGVRPSARGRGLAKQMLTHLVRRPSLSDLTAIQQTIAPSNTASNALFASFAKSLGVPLTTSHGFSPTDFGPHVHEEELLVHIPLRTSAPE